MVPSLLVVLASLQHVPPAATATLPPVALWLADSALSPGARGRTFVRLREPGNVLVLRVDGDGNVSVIFPAAPSEDPVVPGGATYELPGPDGRAAFAVREREGSGTILAARAAAPFQLSALAAGDRWDSGALLFLPTAGDPVAALLDIVDRLTDGRPYDYDVATYPVAGGAAVAAAAPSGERLRSASAVHSATATPAPRVFPSSGYSAPAAPEPTMPVNADCSGAIISEGSACASVTYNAAPQMAALPSPEETYGQQPYAPYYNPYIYYDPFLRLAARVRFRRRRRAGADAVVFQSFRLGCADEA